jgi:hypothetical protein
VGGSSSTLRHYGFAPQLRSALDKALSEALEQIADAAAHNYLR